MAQKINFSINQGIKEYCFADDENAIVRINLRDINLLTRMKEGKATLTKYADTLSQAENKSEDKVIDELLELDKKVKETLDYIFNTNISEIAFGTASSIMIIEGEPRFLTLINAIMPEVEKEIEIQQKEADKKINNYVSQAKGFK